LGDLTRELPKPMLPIEHGRPLLAYLLGHLRALGFREVAINLHFRPEAIRGVFGDGSRWGLRIAYSEEERLLGTAGGVKAMEEFLSAGDAFLVQYGDVLTDHDFRGLIEAHRRRGALATLLVHPRARSNSVICIDDDGRITRFLERPTESARAGVTSPWVNSGVCVCSREVLARIRRDEPADLPRDVFLPLVETGRLYAVPLSGYRCAIDSPDRLEEARRAVAEGRCGVRPLEGADGSLNA